MPDDKIKTGKILIVDDNEDLLKAARIFLKRNFKQVDIEKSPDSIPTLLKNENYDVILCPVNALPAMKHGSESAQDLKPFSYTMTYNLTGWPGAVVRGGTSPEGLPIGVQIVARPWREDIVLAVARLLESELGGFQAPDI